jgi:hypothetical protein
MPSFSKSVIRLQLGIVSNPPVYPIDANTGQAPQIWRSTDVEFQIGIFDQFGAAVDLSNLNFLEVDIFPLPIFNVLPNTDFRYNFYSVPPYPNLPNAPLQFVTLSADEITPKVSLRDWKAGLGQQASAVFTWNQTQALELNGAQFADFWLVVNGLAGVRKITYGGARMRVYESGSEQIFLPNNLAPLTVPLKTVLYVPPNQQMTYAQTINVDGTVRVDGTMIRVN